MTATRNFLFIPSPVGGSRKEHYQSIAKVRSHLSKVHHQRRRREVERHELSSSSPVRHTRHLSAESHAIESPSTSLDNDDTTSSSISTQSSTSTTPTPWSWSNAIRPDPFNCNSLDSTLFADTRYAIQFLVQYVAPVTASMSSPFGLSNVYGGELLKHIALYRDVLHAVAAGMLLLIHAPIDGAPMYLLHSDVNRALAHKSAAIAKLRARLSLPDAEADDAAILTILFLALVEDSEGNDAAYQMHLERVATMVKLRGGIKNLRVTAWTKAVVAQALVANALVHEASGYVNLGSESDYDSASSVEPNAPVGTLPPGFEDLAATGTLTLRLSRLISRIEETTFFPKFEPSPDAVFKYPDNQFHSFLSSDLPLNASDGPDGPSMEKVICLALLRYCHLTSVGRGHKLCLFHSFAMMLQQSLRTVRIPTSRPERRCLIWCWLLAAASFSIGDGDLSLQGIELLVDVKSAFPELRYSDAGDVTKLGKRFLWNDVLTKMVEKNWGRTDEMEAFSPCMR